MPESRISPPQVTMVLTTRDRPGFLPVALGCYRHQSYPNGELVVVDDGDHTPADSALIEEAGGRLIRLPPCTALGTKLNYGIQEARGVLIQKMDDDDWYGSHFLEKMVEAVGKSRMKLCRPLLACLPSFLFFEVSRWEVRRSVGNNMPVATLFCD